MSGQRLFAQLMPAPTIRNKLVALSFLFLLTVVGMVFVLVFTQQKHLLQSQWAGSMAAQARLLASNLQAATAFSDRREAARLLESLAVNPAIVAGRVMLADGSILGEYHRPGESSPAFPDGDESQLFADGYLLVREPIRLDGQTTAGGRIELQVSLAQYHTTMRQTINETALLLLLALTGALLLTRYVVGRLTAPLEKLDDLANRISHDALLDERIATQRSDEIGSLGQSFDRMLDSLQMRDRELANYRESLETMVARRTAELQQATAEARQASSAKSDFLARMSHEIRTPMNAIVGLSHMLVDSPLATQQREYLEQVVQSSESLLGIINDILDYSKIEAGSLTLEKAPFELAAVFRSVAGLFSLKARSKGLTLSFTGCEALPQRLQGDALRLSQVLINLVGNALKFTERGGITVTASRIATADDARIGIAFTVDDSGIGISAEQLDKLFSPFSQADSSITRRFGGTGLGLAICRQLVGLMGGEIKVDSHPGNGSRFRFSAWFDAAPEPAPAVADTRPSATLPRWSGERVLLVEDIPVNRTIAVALLQKVGLSVATAGDGNEALAALERESFRLILMDIQMPVMDGLTAARQIRTDERFRDLPIIAMTAHATREDHEQSSAAGMNAHLTKPIMPRLLYDEIARWLPPLGETSSATDGERAGDLPALAGIDQERGLALHLNRPAFYLKSLHAFRRDFAGSCQAIATALARGETAEARRLAHSLKSVGAALGAGPLAEQACRLEQLLAAPDSDREALATAQHALERCLNELLASLAGLPAPPPPAEEESGSAPEQLFAELENDLRSASASSESAFFALRTALEKNTSYNKNDKIIDEISALIDDVEYEAALEKLQTLRESWTKTKA
ncbi:ATP-binding protein [Azonexus fungiphilus]|uniref:ATP-binding protein n=1 Tax=Azonexus fungiphilus TaxID=146940 RepID=UPI00156B6E0B|nr:ATP-binding protein [Azonexus fungiphilus]NHC06271.1 response regulator [Azonexus fungiphilus]